MDLVETYGKCQFAALRREISLAKPWFPVELLSHFREAYLHGKEMCRDFNGSIGLTRILTQTALTCLALALGVASGAAQDRHLTIHNDTGYTMYKFYSTNTGATSWGSDVLGSDTLPSGMSMRLNFDNSEGYCMFDFRAVFEDGDELARQGVNVCEEADYYYVQ